MATLEQVTEGLATNLETISGVQVSAWMLASPTPPAIHVVPPAIEYHQAMQNGFAELTFTVQAFVALNSDIGAQKLLAQMRAPTGSGSVKAAIEADRTLGGVVKDLIVRSSAEPQVLTLEGGRQLLSCDFEITVWE
jgi:hypothetical protein